ncbi:MULTISPECIES: SH3-like domain-containing protein [Lactobacillus]|uniref:GW domain-containing protein n=1 Tax=Lactobacillus xujianguonis TaxID=2495899 RepID=A0A437STS8_9LACO|nr:MULTISPECIES: SH3-like domain-containing protein [Lactobacillus]RVU70264.1 hypothetical protein EJK17_08450 [Lactobacillus xujianguonis]RVU72071.1 hypothetical protein EJK20_10935 [Lactobacillus xujianguonis]
MKGKNSFKVVMATAALLMGSVLVSTTAKPASAKSFSKAVTKIAGNGNYAIYHNVSGSGPSGKFTSTKYFKHGQIQSKRYVSTKKGNFWDIYVDGRHVGWVSQNFFARNKISVAKDVSLVKNSSYAFPTRDAINYVTNSQGTAVNPSKVHVSQAHVSTAATTVKYSYGKAKASMDIKVYDGQDATADKKAETGFKSTTTWNGGSKGSSRNWNRAHGYRSETSGNTFKSNGLTLRTRLFQPRFVSLGYGQAGDKMGQVGVIPEGITVNGNDFVTSMFTSSSSQFGHLVSYNLNAIKSKTAAQNLTTMSWNSFKSYAQNIKVSPYIKLGHGQSLGSTSSSIYVMANDNNYNNGPKSEEIFQISKSDMKIKKIWTFRIASNRYIHNATFVGDNTMYALFHNGGYNCYEYWKLTRDGDEWTAEEVGATKGRFISNSPVQGFAYADGDFFIGFNDHIFRVNENGKTKKHYCFHTRREIEGMSGTGSNLYVQFAQRAELTKGRI